MNIVRLLKKKYRNFDVVGSVLRKAKNPHDLDLLVLRENYNKLLEKNPELQIVKTYKNRAIAYYGNYKMKIDIFFADKDNYLFTKFMLESPKSYNIRIRNLARLRGYKLSQYGLFRLPDMVPVKVRDEHHLAKILHITDRSIFDRN